MASIAKRSSGPAGLPGCCELRVDAWEWKDSNLPAVVYSHGHPVKVTPHERPVGDSNPSLPIESRSSSAAGRTGPRRTNGSGGRIRTSVSGIQGAASCRWTTPEQVVIVGEEGIEPTAGTTRAREALPPAKPWRRRGELNSQDPLRGFVGFRDRCHHQLACSSEKHCMERRTGLEPVIPAWHTGVSPSTLQPQSRRAEESNLQAAVTRPPA